MSRSQKSQFRSVKERKVTLTKIERRQILGIDPSYRSISKSMYFDNYDLPCPVQVSVVTRKRGIEPVVLRKFRNDDAMKEVGVLRALKRYGLPVPEVLVEPFKTEKGEWAVIYSLLPGENLQKLSMKSGRDLSLAKKLLLEGVGRLMETGEYIRSQKIAKTLPNITLVEELNFLNHKENPWLKYPAYKDALQSLNKIILKIKTPLVMSNGDYQPGNFLARNGKITGYLDFESASFQDPLMGFVKYPIYDIHPLNDTDLIKCFLKKSGFSKKDFDYRLALGCLKVLKKDIPIFGGNKETQEYRNRVLSTLKDSLKSFA